MRTSPIILASQGGVSRDGTNLDGDQYADAQWCRFQRGRPRKMGGYTTLSGSLAEISRGAVVFSEDGESCIHLGGANGLQQINVTSSGIVSGNNTRTPTALSANANNLWQFAIMFDATSVTNKIIAHVAPNLTNIDSSSPGAMYIGDVCGTSLLTALTPVLSGGIFALHPYMFTFGSDGYVVWSDANKPDTYTGGQSGEARITSSKIVAGHKLRGSGNPAGLLWSLDALIKTTFVGGSSIWDFDTIADDLSILSTRSIIEYDGIHFWLETDRIVMFNGVVREVPNNENVNHFFDNLNFAERQKVFAYKVPRFGEIWWCYPRGTATECTHAIIFNIREGYWYDTELPHSGRADGVVPSIYEKPFMTGVDVDSGAYTLWQHEDGVNEVDLGGTEKAIQSYFETAEFAMFKSDEPTDQSMRVNRIEPDFKQTGDMTVIVRGRSNARAEVRDSLPITFSSSASTPGEQTVTEKEVRRLMSFKFESNTKDGDYEMGQPVIHVGPTDTRVES